MATEKELDLRKALPWAQCPVIQASQPSQVGIFYEAEPVSGVEEK